MHTKERLAQALLEAGLADMATKAKTGRYDDFESESATPCMDLVAELQRAGKLELAKRAMDGEWDATSEEAEAWQKSPDGLETFRSLYRVKP